MINSLKGLVAQIATTPLSDDDHDDDHDVHLHDDDHVDDQYDKHDDDHDYHFHDDHLNDGDG